MNDVVEITNEERMSRLQKSIKSTYEEMTEFADKHGLSPKSKKQVTLKPMMLRYYNKLIARFDRLIAEKEELEHVMTLERSEKNLERWGLVEGDIVHSTAYGIDMKATVSIAKQGHVVLVPIYQVNVKYPTYPIALHDGIIDKVKKVEG